MLDSRSHLLIVPILVTPCSGGCLVSVSLWDTFQISFILYSITYLCLIWCHNLNVGHSHDMTNLKIPHPRLLFIS